MLFHVTFVFTIYPTDVLVYEVELKSSQSDQKKNNLNQSIYLTSRMRHNVNFIAEFNKFEIQFSFSQTGCHTKVKEPSLSVYLPIAEGRIVGFIHFPSVLPLYEM